MENIQNNEVWGSRRENKKNLNSKVDFSNTKEVFYRIQLTVAVYKNKKLSYKNEVIVPTWYIRRSEAREHIKKEINKRLKESDFFISPRVDYDLVRYSQEGSCNTYIRYRIIEEEGDIFNMENEITFDKKQS